MVGSGERDQKLTAVAEDAGSDSTPHIEQLTESWIGDPTPMASLDTGVIYRCACTQIDKISL